MTDTAQTRRPKPYRRGPVVPCCEEHGHVQAVAVGGAVALVRITDPYIEEATANPERINNGTMIYKRGA